MEQQFFQYPTFVQNQVLSPDNLNQVFEFLDEQERMSRVYLTGTGVAFGFPVQVASDGTTITIGCGCGVSTQGYLIKMDQTTFNQYAQFEFSSTDMYPPLYSPPPPSSPYTLYELYNDNSTLNIPGNPSVPPPPGVTAMDLSLETFKAPMVLVLYYDLNTVQAMNCNTESCDGMGEITTGSVKVLLMYASEAQQVLNAMGTSGCTMSPSCFYNNLDLNIPRFNVPATQVCSTGDFYAAYIQCLTGNYLLSVMQNAFITIYSQIYGLVSVNYPANIFATFANDYNYLSSAATIINNPQVGRNGFIQLQYYYDYFVNLIDAYNELNEACLQLSVSCCPADIYPQHLFIGQISSTDTATYSSAAPFFFNFVPSIVKSQFGNETDRIISLWARMVAMRQNFSAPPPSVPNATGNGGVIITPTISGPVPLSEKSIPFYYSNFYGTTNPPYNNIAPSVLSNWNYELNVASQSKRNLSYWATAYNSGDMLVSQPLSFDLERYNFFRVEGMVGMGSGALTTISTLQANNRLPFDIVVVTTGACCGSGSSTQDSISTAIFNDLELAYNTALAEITCQFINIAQRLYIFQPNLETTTPTWSNSKVPFLDVPTFRVLKNSAGDIFENSPNGLLKHWNSSQLFSPATWVPIFPTGVPLTSEQIYNSLMFQYSASGYDYEFFIYLPLALPGTACTPVYFMQYILDQLQQGLSGLATVGIGTFNSIWADLVNTCQYYLDYIDLYENWIINNAGYPIIAYAQPIISLIKITYTEILTLCTASVIQEIVSEYDSRVTAYSNANLLSCFITQNPGIQHRAGVPMGGTLVLVEHGPVNPNNINTGTPGGAIDAIIARQSDYFQAGMLIGDFFTMGCGPCSGSDSTTTVSAVSSGSGKVSYGQAQAAPHVAIDVSRFVVNTYRDGTLKTQ